MPDGMQIAVLILALVLWVYVYFNDRKRKQVDGEFGQLERRKVEALERIATALEKRQ